MHENGVLKALSGDDVARTQALVSQLHSQFTCTPGIFQQIRAGCRKQRAARQRQPQRLPHDLHCRSRADKAARATAGARIFLSPAQPCFVNFAALILSAVHAQLFKRKQLRASAHCTARHQHARNIDARHAHHIPRKPLIAACDEDASVKGRGIGLNLDHIRYNLAADQAVIDTVCTLAFTVAHIGAIVACAKSARLAYSRTNRIHQLIQVTAAGMAVAKRAFDKDLGLAQVFPLPASSNAKRIHLWRNFSHFLTFQFHGRLPFTLIRFVPLACPQKPMTQNALDAKQAPPSPGQPCPQLTTRR